jgi:hypothetical protein
VGTDSEVSHIYYYSRRSKFPHAGMSMFDGTPERNGFFSATSHCLPSPIVDMQPIHCISL